MPFVNTFFAPFTPEGVLDVNKIVIPKPPSLLGTADLATRSKNRELYKRYKAHNPQTPITPDLMLAIRRIEDNFFAGLIEMQVTEIKKLRSQLDLSVFRVRQFTFSLEPGMKVDDRLSILVRIEELMFAGLMPDEQNWYNDQLANLRACKMLTTAQSPSEGFKLIEGIKDRKYAGLSLRQKQGISDYLQKYTPSTGLHTSDPLSKTLPSITSHAEFVRKLFVELTVKKARLSKDATSHRAKLLQISIIEDKSFAGLSQIEIFTINYLRLKLQDEIGRVAQLESMLKPDLDGLQRFEILKEMDSLSFAGLSPEVAEYYHDQLVNLEICINLGKPNDHEQLFYVQGMSQREYTGLDEGQKKKIARFIEEAEKVKASYKSN